MINSLTSLRHQSIISGNDKNSNISRLGAAGTHLGEGLVARGIDKDHDPTVGRLDP